MKNETDVSPTVNHKKRRVAIAVVVLAAAIIGIVVFLNAQTSSPSPEPAYADLPDKGKTTEVRGCTIGADGQAYMFKTGKGNHVTLQRIDLSRNSSTELNLPASTKKALGDCRDVAYVTVDETNYLLVAPNDKHHHLLVLRLSDKSATLVNKVSFRSDVVGRVRNVAVESTDGDKVTALVGDGDLLKRVKFSPTQTKSVKKGTAVSGLSAVCDKSLTTEKVGSTEYVYACHGGVVNSTGYVIKYELKGHKLKKVWERPITGCPEAATPWHSRLYVFVEGDTRWANAKGRSFSDRIVSWND